MANTKKQHYVWRNYLRAWAIEEKIWTSMTKLGKVENTNLMNIAQKRYFYKLIDISTLEHKFLTDYITSFSPAILKKLHYDLLSNFTVPSRLKQELKVKNSLKADKKAYDQIIEDYRINAVEKSHSVVENIGNKLIEIRSIEQLIDLEKHDNEYDAIMFLCFQYLRTKLMKERVLSGFKGGEFESIVTNCWNILCFIKATTLACSISMNQEKKFKLLINKTPINFLTSDQPVFNLINDKLDENGKVIDLKFYYPISPNHAITIEFESEISHKYSTEEINESQVIFLNNKVVENSDFFVFANSEKQLQQ